MNTNSPAASTAPASVAEASARLGLAHPASAAVYTGASEPLPVPDAAMIVLP